MSAQQASNNSISVVVPIYKCESCLEQLCNELNKYLSTITNTFEVIFVDDRSPDNSWCLIQELKKKFTFLKSVRLSRNYGQHIAITAGLAEATGDYAVVMDCDLQDPPSLIPDMYREIQKGNDLVLAKRFQRTHSGFRKLAAKLYFHIMSKLTREKVDGEYGSFSMLSRKVIDAFLLFQEKERHYLFILRWLGFKMGTIEYSHQDRYSGASSYTFSKLLHHAVDGVFFQATVLLHWIVAIGLLFSISGVGMAVFYVWRYVYFTSLPGWTSLIVIVLVSTGIILVSMGVVGMYVSKIFEQTKMRPLYVVDVMSDSSS